MGYEDFTDLLEYIVAYPKEFFEYLQEGVLSDLPPQLEMLKDYYDWCQDEFEEWRNSEYRE